LKKTTARSGRSRQKWVTLNERERGRGLQSDKVPTQKPTTLLRRGEIKERRAKGAEMKQRDGPNTMSSNTRSGFTEKREDKRKSNY